MAHPVTPYLRIMAESPTLRIHAATQEKIAAGREVFRFGFGASPFSPPDRVSRTLEIHAHENSYAPSIGLPELRERIAAFHTEIDGIALKPEQVIVGPGSKMLIYALMASFKSLDVLLPAPSWVSYEPQARLLGHRIVRLTTSFEDHWKVTPSLLEAALKLRTDAKHPALLILNTPANPSGQCYSEKELRDIITVARRHRVLILSDEIYAPLHHQGKHLSPARLYEEGTFVTTGLSKWCGAGGWRLGALLMPEVLTSTFTPTLTGILSETVSGAVLPIQKAALEAYDSDADDLFAYLMHQRRILAVAGNYLHAKLEEAGARLHTPQGGFYLFPDFSPLAPELADKRITTGPQLCAHLLDKAGVALLPGSAFGLPEEHLSARLAYVDFNGNAAIAASWEAGLDEKLDDKFVTRYLPRLAEGADRILEWSAAFHRVAA